eukprot:758954-Hanusia_phi.AAC.4
MLLVCTQNPSRFRPVPCHRLDQGTGMAVCRKVKMSDYEQGGIMLAAKTRAAAAAANHQFTMRYRLCHAHSA